ncbi:oxidoreductase [Histoplasma capsulatum H143]|uniref:Oxidoreductase n=1 Tax=Ajellomyces capsulatus (strain H143) TaxID=544712 RepID=C6HM75_AJECH|nr:oxidoreductase [Histoplasma capsulatum H143]
MSYEENFAGIPPFPDDVLCTPLLRLSMEKLIAHDETEVQRFYTACKDLGFFYLDLRGHEILEDANQLFTTGEQLFELDLDEKRRYDFSKEHLYFGYKEIGAAVVDPQGNSDRNEFYNVSLLLSEKPVTRDLQSNMHRLHAISGDQVRIIKAPPQPLDDRRTSLGQHTDFGSVTVLFNRVGGLQILPPGQDAEWCYARPLPGHAIINLGDATVKFTNGLLRSNIHRVVSPPGAQAETTRYSLVYFARPEDDVILKRLEGSDCIPPLTLRDETAAVVEEEEIRSKDWIIRRALGNRRALHKEIDYAQSMGTESMSRRIYA